MTTSPNTSTPIEGQEPTNNTSTSSAESKDTAASDMPTKDTNTKIDGASSVQPSNKKRRSNIQLNKDDHPEGNSDDDDGELNDEGTKRSDPFKRSSEDVIKKRKIVKASSKWGSGGNGSSTNGGGTFASVNLAAPTENSNKDNTASIFGSSSTSGSTFGSATASTSLGFGSVGGSNTANKSGGFGSGFGSVSSGFGSLKSSSTEKDNSTTTKSTGFGGGFGAVSSGFGSLKSSTTAPSSFGFGTSASTTTNNDDTTSSPDKTTNGSGLATNNASSPSSKFPTSSVVDTTNGEEDEECMCQVRAKLFKMVQEAKNDDNATNEREAVPSVPSTSGRMDLGQKDNDNDDGKNSPEKTKEEATEKKGPNMVQKEAGIGPVRVLKRKSSSTKDDDDDKKQSTSDSRVVQRQETGKGGQATRVLLNIRLVPKTCSVIRRGDKFVQLNAPNSITGELESSLFKVKTTADADTLENELKDALEDKGEA